ncbi:hypothetical protein NDU88_006472 [Pleurodeles waltl]|uniref:Uncharacterized protein n=1 Tax=Pleurodeles waltl TaxID=8319 RepID=A0AAV7TWY5_PLEWA|nr:hypothetical protein NDU88_006472 [Pleurodeles waltl]
MSTAVLARGRSLVLDIAGLRSLSKFPHPWCGGLLVTIQGEGYAEEETSSVLPIDNEFCDAVDAAFQLTAAAAIEPLERRLFQLAHSFPAPLTKSTLGPSDWGQSAHSPSKRKLKYGLDTAPFEKVKQALVEPSTKDGNSLSLLLSADPEEDDLHDSTDEAGPYRPWQPVLRPTKESDSSVIFFVRQERGSA